MQFPQHSRIAWIFREVEGVSVDDARSLISRQAVFTGISRTASCEDDAAAAA